MSHPLHNIRFYIQNMVGDGGCKDFQEPTEMRLCRRISFKHLHQSDEIGPHPMMPQRSL